MIVDPVYLILSGSALAAAAAYGMARSKYQEAFLQEVRAREPKIDRARAEERERYDNLARETREQLRVARDEAEELRRSLDTARQSAETARQVANLEAREMALRAIEEVKEEARKLVEEAESHAESAERRATLLEKTAAQKEEHLQKKEGELEKLEQAIQAKETSAISMQRQATELVNARRARLEALSGLSGEQARQTLMSEVLTEVREDMAREVKAIEDAARTEVDARAKRILGIAIQRFAGESVQERAVTTVHLPSDDMKGRIIGREGRNIRALQEACGLDIIIDETPETILISGFDPVRREVARVALERLVADGRIQPSRIEEEVARAQQDVEKALDEAAERAMLDLGVLHVHPEIQKLLGRLHHRYSFGQNVLRHSAETGFLTGMMAVELGLDEKLGRRAGFLHDIGKAVSHEQEGGHAVIGGQLARKYGEDPVVVNAIAAHHEDEPVTTVYTHLVTAADALSGARPGARREMLEGYVKRLRDLEIISSRFAGVERSYALQAGREVRVIVEPSEVSDAEAVLLAREISKRIEKEMSYPGQIRVTVIRETRAIDYAK
ncbi:ribonuclease Y [Pendulispora albinea]|uniref:Ribonuclease Y n=1 Tax=Pendulispora albinea TaxID=2741071 RepID=A0ABZ2LTS3_9BACT